MDISLQRYESDDYGIMIPISEGDYVLYSDVVNLLKELKEQHRELFNNTKSLDPEYVALVDEKFWELLYDYRN